MTQVAPVLTILQQEELRFRAAVSEATGQRIGAAVNFIQQNVYQVKQFFVNGNYNLLTLPFTGIDGLEFFFNNATLVDAALVVKTAGSSGNTSFDLKYATTPGGSFTSIFSTPPSINYQAGNYAWCRVGTSFPNTVAPIISVPSMPAGSVIRADILSAQGGTPFGAFLILRFQSR